MHIGIQDMVRIVLQVVVQVQQYLRYPRYPCNHHLRTYGTAPVIAEEVTRNFTRYRTELP